MIEVIAAYSAATYLADVVCRPNAIAKVARAAARSKGKPLLNVGAGTPSSSLRVALFGDTSWGDINVDLAATRQWRPGLTSGVFYGDVHSLPFPDGMFGAAIASHVIEHVDDPQKALKELCRVADVVFVVWPAWWAPHTWLHPGHQWYRRPDGSHARLWRK